jgi:endoglucanase
MREASLAFLQTLLETPSPSGFETRGQRIWLDYVSKFADEVQTDSYGNCYAILNPKGSPKVLLGGHSDELGFMINYISDAGFIYFKGIGGVDNTLIRGQRVTVHGRNGPIAGVTGLLAIHLQESDDRKKVPGIHEMYIDIGASSKKEAEAWVQIGDAITYSAGFQFLGQEKKRIAARGCDNRIGTFAAAEGLRKASENRGQLKACVVAASTIQEENGLYGANMAGYRIKPDVALVVDVTHATDIPSCSKEKFGDVKLGKGPVISFGSANHPVINERLEKIAEKNKMALQREINPRCTGTDADAIFVLHGGIPTASVGLPNRYMHSPVEVIELSDLEAIGELLGNFVLDLKSDETFQVKI